MKFLARIVYSIAIGLSYAKNRYSTKSIPKDQLLGTYDAEVIDENGTIKNTKVEIYTSPLEEEFAKDALLKKKMQNKRIKQEVGAIILRTLFR